MRQFKIMYRNANSPSWATLQPGAHKALYDQPLVGETLELLASKPHLEAVCVRCDGALYNIITFSQPALAPDAFDLVGYVDHQQLRPGNDAVTLPNGD